LTEAVEPDGTEAKNELLTQGDPWIERFKEVSRGRSSEEAR